MQVHIHEMGKVIDEKAAWGAIEHDDSRARVDGVIVLRPDSPIFWANADKVFDEIRHRVRHREDVTVAILDLEASNQMDSTTADRFGRLMADLRSEGVDIYLVRVFRRVREVLDQAGFLDELGDGRLWHSISAGVKAARDAAPYAEEQIEDELLDGDEHIAAKPTRD